MNKLVSSPLPLFIKRLYFAKLHACYRHVSLFRDQPPNNRINIISSGWIDDQTRSPDNRFHPRRARFRITRQLIATMAAMDPSIGRFN